MNFNYFGSEVKENENFYGKKFVITGTLETYKREELAKLIENFGGEVIKSVSKNIDVLICGDKPGSKYDKAKELNIEIWDEKKALSMFE